MPIILAAEEELQKSPDSPIALAITIAAAVLLSILLDRRAKKKKEKMRKFMEEKEQTSTEDPQPHESDTE